MKSVALHNLGCKVNAYELEVMQQKLQDRGYKIVPFDSDADIYIVNTCTVTNIAAPGKAQKSGRGCRCGRVLCTGGRGKQNGRLH